MIPSETVPCETCGTPTPFTGNNLIPGRSFSDNERLNDAVFFYGVC